MGEPWGVYCKYFLDNWLQYNGTELYCKHLKDKNIVADDDNNNYNNNKKKKNNNKNNSRDQK